MLKDDTVEITVNNSTIKWYREKGYDIPTKPVQSYCKNKKGERKRNGIRERVQKGTKIIVKVEDLAPKSNQEVTLVCERCGKEYTTQYRAYKSKKTNLCTDCEKKRLKNGGCHSYWVDELITRNPEARCDISKETDKRFLVLHHLMSRSNGGQNEPDNYVTLSANYHMAFHNEIGGTQYGCTPEQYYEFKERECEKLMVCPVYWVRPKDDYIVVE